VTPDQTMFPLSYGDSSPVETKSLHIFKKVNEEGRMFIERKLAEAAQLVEKEDSTHAHHH